MTTTHPLKGEAATTTTGPLPPHPDLPHEQAVVDAAYRQLDRRRDGRSDQVPGDGVADLKAAAALKRRLAQEKNRLVDDGRALVFQRVDVAGRSHYVGKVAVWGEDRELLVMPWHAAEPQRWARLTPSDAGEVDLRRRLVCSDR